MAQEKESVVFVAVQTENNPMTGVYRKLNIFEFDEDPETSEKEFAKLRR